MTRRTITSLAGALALLSTLGLAAPARADMEQNGASADALLKDVLVYVAELFDEADIGSQLEFAGEPSARPQGYKVEMLFPGPALVGTTGSSLRMEDITAVVTPKDQDEFAFAAELPNSAKAFRPGGEPEVEFTWSGSNLRGVWRADLEAATILHSTIYDLRATDAEQTSKPAVIRLDALTVDQDLREGANELWRGPFSLVLKKFGFAPPDDEMEISFGEFSTQTKIDDFDLKAWNDLSTRADSISLTDEFGQAEPPQDIGEAIRIIENLNLGAGEATLTIHDLHFFQPGEQAFTLSELTLGADYDNDRRPGGYGLTLAWRDLEISDLDIPREFFTHTGSLKLGFERFPARQILLATIGAAENLGAAAGLDESQAMQLFALPLIHTNRSVINIEELTLESSAAALHASGKLIAEAQSAMGAIGEARVEVAGLDKLIATAAREALRDPSAQSALAFLAIAKGLGMPEIAANGKLVYVFDVVLPPDGRVTINEIPLDLIMNSGAARLSDGEAPLS